MQNRDTAKPTLSLGLREHETKTSFSIHLKSFYKIIKWLALDEMYSELAVIGFTKYELNLDSGGYSDSKLC